MRGIQINQERKSVLSPIQQSLQALQVAAGLVQQALHSSIQLAGSTATPARQSWAAQLAAGMAAALLLGVLHPFRPRTWGPVAEATQMVG